MGANEGISTWFENASIIKIPIKEINLDFVSFTYGDTLTVFNAKLFGDEEYWGKVYKYNDMLNLIDKYGYPEDCIYNGIKGIYPTEKPFSHYPKYIEAHIWSDEVFEKYIHIEK